MNVEELINQTIFQSDCHSYLNIMDGQYLGWTVDFGFKLPNGIRMRLNLNNEYDLFLLFCLASAWSRTGPWENAAVFVSYLKHTMSMDSIMKLSYQELLLSKPTSQELLHFVEQCENLKPRKSVSFRKDLYNSIEVLRTEWSGLLLSLSEAERCANYFNFINHLRSIRGLGTGNNKMLIKIPLILRELRCQNIYENIPGELCCVVDKRVKNSAKLVGINLPVVYDLKSLVKASSQVYEYFGDLYDLPLFAYEDLI